MANNPPFDDADAKIIPFRLPGSGSGRKRPHTGTTQHMQPSEGQSIKARGGLFFEFGVQAAPQRTRDEQTIATAWQRLLDMMAQGKLPEPAADYQLEQISYNPRFMGLNGGKQAVLAVEHVPSGPRSGSIIAFAPAAETLEHAVRCLAHELYRFHPSQGQDDDRCYQYAQSAVRILNGGKYAGPDVNEGLQAKEQPERDKVQGPTQLASLVPVAGEASRNDADFTSEDGMSGLSDEMGAQEIKDWLVANADKLGIRLPDGVVVIVREFHITSQGGFCASPNCSGDNKIAGTYLEDRKQIFLGKAAFLPGQLDYYKGTSENPNISSFGDVMGYEKAIFTFAHEVAHANGVDKLPLTTAHPNADAWGKRALKAYRKLYCGGKAC